MPELPEVETIRGALEDLLVGREIVAAGFRRQDILRPDPRSPRGSVRRCIARTRGARVDSLGRLGKNLLLRLDEGWGWVIHLGMSGTLIAADPGDPEEDHTHVVLRPEGNLEIRFRDPRRFGSWRAAETPPVEEVLGDRVGIDALDPGLDVHLFAKLLGNSDSPIKCRLLDQRLVAGLGNIYVDEALFAARVHPAKPARELDSDSWSRLYRAVGEVLRGALRNRGTTFSDYRDARGKSGDNADNLAVYGRGGRECLRCASELVRTKLRGRGTHYCPRCQPYRKGGGEAGA